MRCGRRREDGGNRKESGCEEEEGQRSELTALERKELSVTTESPLA
jgi:hypothetical protein